MPVMHSVSDCLSVEGICQGDGRRDQDWSGELWRQQPPLQEKRHQQLPQPVHLQGGTGAQNDATFSSTEHGCLCIVSSAFCLPCRSRRSSLRSAPKTTWSASPCASSQQVSLSCGRVSPAHLTASTRLTRHSLIVVFLLLFIIPIG